MTLVLCGFKNCGKTTLGKKLANKTGTDFIDTDDLIIAVHRANTGQDLDISDVFKALGNDEFRALEQSVIAGISPNGHIVVATGGGAIMDDVSVKKLKSLGKLVYLFQPKNILISRFLAQPKMPAFVKDQDQKVAFEAYYDARKDRYSNVADEIIELQDISPSKWVEHLVALMEKEKQE